MRTADDVVVELEVGGTPEEPLVRAAFALGRSEMEAEVARLRAEVQDNRAEIARWREVVGQGMEERDGLRAEVARAALRPHKEET